MTDWEAYNPTKPDGISMRELQEALARRLAERGPAPTREIPASDKETREIERTP